MSRTFTIYCHTAPNGKRYVGQTCQDPEYRWRNGAGYEKSPYFKNAIQKYGWDNIKHDVLCWCSSKENADFLEQWFIKKFDSCNPKHGYNLTKGGGGGLGRKMSDKCRAKISRANSERVWTEEQRKKVSETMKRKIQSGEIVRKPMSEEARRKQSIERSGVNNPRYGTHHSPETIERMRKSHKGKTITEEQRRKLSESHLKCKTKKRCPVHQFTLDGELIASYGSMKEAERETGIFSSAIRTCCIGRSHQSGGYIWCLQDKPETFPVAQTPRKGLFS